MYWLFCRSAVTLLCLPLSFMWYPPQNNIALHSPQRYCSLLIHANRLWLHSFSFLDLCVCVSESYWCVYPICVCVLCIFVCTYVLFWCACLLCSNLEIFHILNSPKYTKPIQTALSLNIVFNQILSSLKVCPCYSWNLTLYFIRNKIIVFKSFHS